MAKYNTDTYQVGIVDYRAKVEALFLSLDVARLNVEGASKVEMDGSPLA